jgi:hypothetical protein
MSITWFRLFSRSFFALGEASQVRSLLAGGPFHEVQLLTAVLTVRFASPEQFVRIEMFPLHQRHGKLTPFPADQHERVMFAFLLWSHSYDLNLLIRFQRRGRATNDAAGRKRKLQGVVEIVVPSRQAM